MAMSNEKHLLVPSIDFKEDDDAHEIHIPDGHAAIVVKLGAPLSRVDLSPGVHTIKGTSFVEYEAPFGICVLKSELADIAARSKMRATGSLDDSSRVN